jgi:hypothetical protein
MSHSLKFISVCLFSTLLSYTGLKAQVSIQNSLNPDIIFAGDHLLYKGDKIKLGSRAFYIDGQITEKEAGRYPYVFRSVNEAAKHLTNGTEAEPMVLYIAPWVYWIDDPDDPAIRLPKETGGTPFGLEIKCSWLKFHGLSDNPRDVVLASNRGQTMGAKGNFTMLLITGDGTSTENLTFGNYCNIDLEYPLNPGLNRPKRGSAIVQAQLAFTYGDKIFARNTHFVSRLNLCPFVGGQRTLFDHCHFESTDDALASTAVYLNSSFDLYSSKPFYHTIGTGAVLLNCTIRSFTIGEQYWSKSRGQLAAIDCRMETSTATYWGWRDKPDPEARYYDYHNSINGKQVVIGMQHPHATVEMSGKSLLDAYRFTCNGEVIYNVYNLLRGDDDWDPLGQKERVLAAEKINHKSYTNLPTQLVVSPSRDSIETGRETLLLKATVNKFGNYELENQQVTWSIAKKDNSLARLEALPDGSCRVIPTNTTEEIQSLVVRATTTSGLEGAALVYLLPEMMEAPPFRALPTLEINADGTISVGYALDMPFTDQSLVSWYRCRDAAGSDPVEVAVSRMNVPHLHYKLSAGDIGWHLMAKVEPKHSRCLPGKPERAVTRSPIQSSHLKGDSRKMRVNLKNMSTRYQPEVKQGFFTLDCFAPEDTRAFDMVATNEGDPWYYGNGVEGAATDTGLVQANKGARLRYTPVGDTFHDMKISFTAVPAKTAGQGFSSARQQYMDVCIKFDTKGLNGYALRLIRTTKYSDAIDFVLMRYEGGIATPISDPVSSDCYRPDCHILLEVKGNRFRVQAENSKNHHIVPDRPGVVQTVLMEAEITPEPWGGFGFQHTGTVGSGATLIKDLQVEWR